MAITVKSVLLKAFSVLLIFIIGCAATGSNIDKESYKDSEIRIYEVFGMDCPACAGGLDKLVEKLPAVKKSEANWNTKQLTVIIEPGEQLQDDDILDAIKNANFTPGERIK